MNKIIFLLLLVLTVGMTGCASQRPTDYRAYVKHMPRSIVVLPPINESAEVAASDAFLSTVTKLLAEKGYYVFPVALVDQHMKENGVTIPGEMHQVNPTKFNEVYGADAVMLIHIKEWTTTYIVLDSTTKVTLAFNLVDTNTGQSIWQQASTYAYSSSQGQSNLAAMVVAATVRAIASAAVDFETNVARYANQIAFYNEQSGLLLGPLHPKYQDSQVNVQAKLQALEKWDAEHPDQTPASQSSATQQADTAQ
jgi:hypothetical protein